MASNTALLIAKAVARETDEAIMSSIEGTLSNSTANILAWINEGYEQVWNRAWKNESAEIKSTFTASAETYDFSAASIDYFKSVWITGYKPLDMMDYDRLLREYPNDGSIKGQPIKGSYHGKKIFFWPIPESSYTINYTAKAKFTRLSTNADVPLVDSNCLKEYAKYKQFCRDGNTNAAQIAFVDFERLSKNFADNCKHHNAMPQMIRTEDEIYSDNLVTLDEYWNYG